MSDRPAGRSRSARTYRFPAARRPAACRGSRRAKGTVERESCVCYEVGKVSVERGAWRGQLELQRDSLIAPRSTLILTDEIAWPGRGAVLRLRPVDLDSHYTR